VAKNLDFVVGFDKRNAAGRYDPEEPPFTEAELEAALDWRQRYGMPTRARPDHCPHPVPCVSVASCVEAIAWYRRHQRAIEADA
jgi:hypothetical protein